VPRAVTTSTKKKPRNGSVIELRRYAGAEVYCRQLDGLRVAHVTDIHVGRVTPLRVQLEAAELTNREEPDLIVMTGDFVCHGQGYLDQLTEVVEAYDAPVITVMGNHDYWSGVEEVRRALRKAGAEVLDNRWTALTLRHQRLQIVGLDDAYTGHAARSEAVKGLDPKHATLGLSHIAEEADGLWARGVPLVLSGHTHGGQVTLARLHELSVGKLAGHKYVHGLYGSRHDEQEPGGAVYVGAGIGAAVIPLRLGDRGRREVAIFELGETPGELDEHHEEQAPLKGRKPKLRTKLKRHIAVKKKRQKREKKRAKKRAKKSAKKQGG
jgi:predicted MPP superfamily phosphohydrolase